MPLVGCPSPHQLLSLAQRGSKYDGGFLFRKKEKRWIFRKGLWAQLFSLSCRVLSGINERGTRRKKGPAGKNSAIELCAVGERPLFRRPIIAIAIREKRKNGGRSHVACTVWRKVVSIRIFDMNRMCRVHILYVCTVSCYTYFNRYASVRQLVFVWFSYA